MTLHGELTTQDWLAARWEFLRVQLRDSLWHLLLVAVIVALFLYSQTFPAFILLIGLMQLIPRAFLLAEYAFLIRLQPSSLRGVLKRANALPGPREITIDDTGLSITGPFIEKRIDWNDTYRQFQIGRDYLLVFESFHRYQVFSRRWFTEEEYTTFQDSLRQGLAKRP